MIVCVIAIRWQLYRSTLSSNKWFNMRIFKLISFFFIFNLVELCGCSNILTLHLLTPDISGATYLACVTNTLWVPLHLAKWKLHRSIKGYWIILDIKVLPFTMFLFQFVKHIIETVIEIYEILLIWWVDPQYPWSHGIVSPIWGSSITRVKCTEQCLV